MFSLHSSDSQSMGRRILRRPMMLMGHRIKKIERGIGRAVGSGTSSPAKAASTTRPPRGESKTYQSTRQATQTRGNTKRNEKSPTAPQTTQKKTSASHSTIIPSHRKSSVVNKEAASKRSYTPSPAYRSSTVEKKLQKRSTLAEGTASKASSVAENKKEGLHRPNIRVRRRMLAHYTEKLEAPTASYSEQPSSQYTERDTKKQEKAKQNRPKRPLSAEQTFSVPTDSEKIIPAREEQRKVSRKVYSRQPDSFAKAPSREDSSQKKPAKAKFSMQPPDSTLPPMAPSVKNRPVAPLKEKVPRQKSKSRPKKRGRDKS